MHIAMLGLYGIPTKIGGVERMVEEVGARLAAKGHTVRVYCRKHYTEPMTEHRGMEIVRLPSLNTKYTDTFSHTFLATLHLITHPVDVAHYHSLGPSIFSFFPRLFGIKTIVQVHGLEWTDKKWGKIARFIFKYIFEPIAMYFPNCIASDGKYWKKFLEDKYHRPVTFIPNGVNVAPAASSEAIRHLGLSPKNYILFMGRLVPQKGCHYLIKAYQQIDTDFPLIFAGGSLHSDDYVAQLKAMAGEDKRIRFIGFVHGDLWAQLMSNAYAMVFPSEAEGQSVGLLEAMGFANCIIASDIPENLEALEDTGLTFRSGDLNDLINKINQVIQYPEIPKDLEQKAVKRATSMYSWDRSTEIAENIYVTCKRGK